MTDLADKLEALAQAVTPENWQLIYYDAGDYDYYDANGPCPGIFSEQEDCGIVHWDGFKQRYWTSANGNQRQIEANASLIVELRNNLPAIIRALRERDQAVEALRDQQTWHEERVKVLSKQPPAPDRDWRLTEHREQLDSLRAALASIEGAEDEG